MGGSRTLANASCLPPQGPAPLQRSRPGAMSCASSMKGFVVNQVNPKFKEYNKPFCLAVVVAIPTAALTLGLFAVMLNNCSEEVKIFPMASHMKDGIDKAKCATQTFYTSVNANAAEYYPCSVAGATYCDDAQSDFPSAAACSSNGAFMAEVRVCPSPLSTLGAALGYAGFIELAITVVCVFALQQCGILRGGPEGYMGQLIKEIADGKDTGKEIGGEVGVA